MSWLYLMVRRVDVESPGPAWLLFTLNSLLRTSPHHIYSLLLVFPPSVLLLHTEGEEDFEAEDFRVAYSALAALARTFIRQPVAADFARFKLYAARVQTLDNQFSLHIPCPRTPIDNAVWKVLSENGPVPLLPNLRHLFYNEGPRRLLHSKNPSGEPYFYPAKVLLGPSLLHVDVNLEGREQPQGIIARLTKLSSKLTFLSLVNQALRPMDLPDLPGCITGCHLPNLADITEWNTAQTMISPQFLVHLASQPNLRYLEFKTERRLWRDRNVFPSERRSTLFPALKALYVHFDELEWCVAFLNVIASPVLETVKLTLDRDATMGPIDNDLLRALCTALKHHPSRPHIREVGIRLGSTNGFKGCLYGGLDSEPDIFGPETITPLVQLESVTNLTVLGWCDIYLDDHFFKRAIGHWSQLEHLELYCGSPRKMSFSSSCLSSVTLASLAILAGSCPRLRVLSLLIDAKEVPLDDPTDPMRYCVDPEKSSLTTLVVGSSPLKDPVKVASFLSRIFPKLECLRNDGHDRACARLWTQTNRLLREFKLIRCQERSWVNTRQLHRACQ
ncbi:hypothetical protein LXA43DRAFT_1066304 [Ganoderma leucocontextum]|nr:hypothetical protein LXA43DRAFT_1066304 [Ganoderma leucocontextum]